MTRTTLLIALFALAAFGCAELVGARAGGVAPASPYERKVDEYGNIHWGDERARLDNFAIEMQNIPSATGYLICYGGRRGRVGEANRRCHRAMGYLDRQRRIDAARIVTVDGGFREELTVELWIIPPGMTPPIATPTVDPNEVKFIKPPKKRRTPRR